MTVKVTTAEQTLLTAIATDSNDANANGIQVQPSTAIATTIYPITNYTTAVPSGSATETKVKDGIIGLYAPLIRRIGPLMGQVSNTSPSLSFNSTTDLLSYSLPSNLEVARTVEILANGTCYSDTASNRIDFWIDVNGTATSVFKLFFNEALSHRTFAGSWIVTLPVGAVTIKLRATLGAGSGHIVLDGADFLNVTFKG